MKELNMKKVFVFLFVVAVFLIFAFTPTAPVESCGDEVVMAEMVTVETEVTVLIEYSLPLDIEMSEAMEFSVYDEDEYIAMTEYSHTGLCGCTDCGRFTGHTSHPRVVT
jgi:hypothetical protein